MRTVPEVFVLCVIDFLASDSEVLEGKRAVVRAGLRD